MSFLPLSVSGLPGCLSLSLPMILTLPHSLPSACLMVGWGEADAGRWAQAWAALLEAVGGWGWGR